MFGLTFEKLIIVGVIAAFVIGPERLPHYAAKLAQFVKQLREFTNGAKTRMKEEMGPDFDEVEWKKLDPRQYDPRRIIRDALLEDVEVLGQDDARLDHVQVVDLVGVAGGKATRQTIRLLLVVALQTDPIARTKDRLQKLDDGRGRYDLAFGMTAPSLDAGIAGLSLTAPLGHPRAPQIMQNST